MHAAHPPHRHASRGPRSLQPIRGLWHLRVLRRLGSRRSPWLTPWLLAVALLAAGATAALAHAILVEASPAAGSLVAGPDLEVRLRFNSRIDGARSRLALAQPGKHERALALAAQPAPDLLTAKVGGLAPGAYKLRWQVLAADGHISRGEVPFRVK